MIGDKFSMDEETLDPQNWDAMRALGHRMVDDMLNYLQDIREHPVWQPIPDNVKDKLRQPLPLEPQLPERVYQDFLEYVLPHPLGNIHPRFWGWVMGTGTPLGMLAEMLAAGMNPNLWGTEHVANYVEAQVLDWCKAMMGFPKEASGLLVSGGSMANLIGLAVARNAQAGFDIRRQGVSASPKPLVLYASMETHSSVQKAVELMGLGSQSLRKIAVNADFQIDLEALEKAIADDRAMGLNPICLVGNAGTVNTGAIDDLNSLANLAAREGMWFHVDGAVGALAALSPELRPLVSGIERADSLAYDLHKWMSIPIEAGCVLVRDAEAHFNAFTLTAAYLSQADRGLASGTMGYYNFGLQLTRGFRALKVWMSFKEHGIRKYGRVIQKNVEQARYLANLVEEAPELELLAPVSLNIVCFRFKNDHLDDSQLDELNKELLIRLYESGIAVPSYTTLRGKYALRVANVNHRSRNEDFDILVSEVIRLGKELMTS